MNTPMLTKTSARLAAGLLVVAALVGACSSTGGSSGGLYGTQGVAGVTSTPVATQAPAAIPARARIANTTSRFRLLLSRRAGVVRCGAMMRTSAPVVDRTRVSGPGRRNLGAMSVRA